MTIIFTWEFNFDLMYERCVKIEDNITSSGTKL